MKIIFENKQPLNEDKIVKFGGQTFPKFGWCVILMGGGGSGKGTAFNSLIPVEGAYLNVDDLKENPAWWSIRPSVRDEKGNPIKVKGDDGKEHNLRAPETYMDRVRDNFLAGNEKIDDPRNYKNIEDYLYMSKEDVITPGEKIKGREPYDPKLKGKNTYETGQGRNKLKLHMEDPTVTGYAHNALRPLGKAWKKYMYDVVGTSSDKSRLPNVIFDIQADELKDIRTITQAFKPKGYKIAVVWMLSTVGRALKNNSVGRNRMVDEDILIQAHKKVINTAKKLFASNYISNIDEFWVINTNTSNKIFDKKYSRKANQDLYHDAQTCFQVPTNADGLDTFMIKYNENPYWSENNKVFNLKNRMSNQLKDIDRRLSKKQD
jgi:hypothetical protein